MTRREDVEPDEPFPPMVSQLILPGAFDDEIDLDESVVLGSTRLTVHSPWDLTPLSAYTVGAAIKAMAAAELLTSRPLPATSMQDPFTLQGLQLASMLGELAQIDRSRTAFRSGSRSIAQVASDLDRSAWATFLMLRAADGRRREPVRIVSVASTGSMDFKVDFGIAEIFRLVYEVLSSSHRAQRKEEVRHLQRMNELDEERQRLEIEHMRRERRVADQDAFHRYFLRKIEQANALKDAGVLTADQVRHRLETDLNLLNASASAADHLELSIPNPPLNAITPGGQAPALG